MGHQYLPSTPNGKTQQHVSKNKQNNQTKTRTIVIPFCPYFVHSSQGKITGANNTNG
jgi:hypothetical protein